MLSSENGALLPVPAGIQNGNSHYGSNGHPPSKEEEAAIQYYLEHHLPKFKRFAGMLVIVDMSGVLFSYFIAGNGIRSIEYISGLPDSTASSLEISAILSVPLMGNVGADYFSCAISKTAAEYALMRNNAWYELLNNKVDELLNKHDPVVRLGVRNTLKAANWVVFGLSAPCYVALSLTSSISAGRLFGNRPAIVYPLSFIFNVPSTLYYFFTTIGRRAESLVGLYHRIMDWRRLLLLDLLSQPFMSLEAAIEASITIAYRTIAASYHVLAFLTETLGYPPDDPLVLDIVKAIFLSAALDVISTRIKISFDDNLQYGHIGYKQLYAYLNRDNVARELTSSAALLDFFLSTMRGVGIGILCNSIGWTLGNSLGWGALFFAHALYGKWMKRFRSAIDAQSMAQEQHAVVEAKASPEDNSIQAIYRRKQQLFADICKLHSDELERPIVVCVFLGRVARFVAFPQSLISLDSAVVSSGIKQPADFWQIMSAWILIGVPFFSNEHKNYVKLVKDALPEKVAMNAMNNASHRRQSRCEKVSGYFCTLFGRGRPPEFYSFASLQAEKQRLIDKKTNPPPALETQWSSCTIL